MSEPKTTLLLKFDFNQATKEKSRVFKLRIHTVKGIHNHSPQLFELKNNKQKTTTTKQVTI